MRPEINAGQLHLLFDPSLICILSRKLQLDSWDICSSASELPSGLGEDLHGTIPL